jgi:hypothetical protein
MIGYTRAVLLQVGIHITHNGDFDAMEAFGTTVSDAPLVRYPSIVAMSMYYVA